MMGERPPFWFVFVLATLPLLGWWATGLFDLDEGFYGAVVAEMNRRGEWIVPYYNGLPWWEKPILLYWLAKPTVAAFGFEFGARLPSVLCALLGYAFVYWWAKRRLSLAAAQIALIVLGTSVLWVGLSRMMMTDVPLAVAYAAACLLFYESAVGDPRWKILVGALLGVGVLAKGPVALLLFIPVAGWMLWRHPSLRKQGKRGWLGLAVAMVLVAGAWYLPAFFLHREQFVQKFLIEQNLNRFTGGDAAHTLGGIGSLFVFIPVLLLGMAPWSFRLFGGWGQRDAATSLLWTMALVPFLFFSLSGAKLVHYVLPCIIPLALLVADKLSYSWSEDGKTLHTRKVVGASVASVVVLIVANVGFYFWYTTSGHAELHTLARKVPPGANAAVYQMSRRQKDRGTGKLKLQETAHPSLAMVLDRVLLEAEAPNDLAKAPLPLYVLTRNDRLSTEDFTFLRAKGVKVTRISTDARSRYQLFLLATQVGVSSLATPPPKGN